MITNLHIKNIGIIEEVTLNLNEGFNVLTGETGAGKTLIIDSLSIISGGRFSKEMIRKGENYSLVEACLYLPDNKFSQDSNVIVSREIFSNGKNLCKINGRFVTVAELRDFMKNHIDIHGQNDNQKIMDVSTHIDYLDSFSDELLVKIKEYESIYNEYLILKNELSNNYGDDIEKERTLDLLEYQLNEISAANLKVNEDIKLEERAKKIQNLEKINNSLNSSALVLKDKTLSSLDEVLKFMSKIENIDRVYLEKYNKIKSIYYDIEDLASQIDSYCEDTVFEEENLDYIFKRIELISDLKRKYGNSIEEILKYKDKIYNNIETIKNLDEYRKSLKLKIEKMEEILNTKAEDISKVRKEKAILLEEKINQELSELNMKNAKFKIEIKNDKTFNSKGIDKVEFLVKTNAGEEFKPLVKIASGGEISRIMISIKSVFSEKDLVQTCIFDEVDTGISGNAAMSVGMKLSKISKSHQVICVTHSSIIAAASNFHYFISKSVVDNNTKTEVYLLEKDKSLEEIARISSGIVNDLTVSYAIELKNQFQN